MVSVKMRYGREYLGEFILFVSFLRVIALSLGGSAENLKLKRSKKKFRKLLLRKQLEEAALAVEGKKQTGRPLENEDRTGDGESTKTSVKSDKEKIVALGKGSFPLKIKKRCRWDELCAEVQFRQLGGLFQNDRISLRKKMEDNWTVMRHSLLTEKRLVTVGLDEQECATKPLDWVDTLSDEFNLKLSSNNDEDGTSTDGLNIVTLGKSSFPLKIKKKCRWDELCAVVQFRQLGGLFQNDKISLRKRMEDNWTVMRHSLLSERRQTLAERACLEEQHAFTEALVRVDTLGNEYKLGLDNDEDDESTDSVGSSTLVNTVIEVSTSGRGPDENIWAYSLAEGSRTFVEGDDDDISSDGDHENRTPDLGMYWLMNTFQ